MLLRDGFTAGWGLATPLRNDRQTGLLKVPLFKLPLASELWRRPRPRAAPLSPLLGSIISSFCQEVFYLFFSFFLLPCLGGEAQRRKARYKEGLSYGRAAYFP